MKGLADGAETKRATGWTRLAEISPSVADLTEGIAFGLFEDDSPVVPTLKIKLVQAKPYVLRLKREGKMKPLSERRIPEGQHGKLMSTDLVILLNLVFGPSHGDVPANQRTIAQSGCCSSTPGS